MSQEETHVSLLREAYQKWHDTKAGSAYHWLALMTDDVRSGSLASGAAKMEFTRTSSCKEEVKQYFSQLTSQWEMIHDTIREYIAQGDRVVASDGPSTQTDRQNSGYAEGGLSPVSRRKDL